MAIRQLSVFAENKNGSLYEITKILAQNDVNMRAFSVADTKNFGVIRLIVDDPKRAAMALSSEGKIVNVTEVVGVKIPDYKGGLSELLGILAKSEIGIEYLYAFVGTEAGKAHVVLRVEDNAATEAILREKGFELIEV